VSASTSEGGTDRLRTSRTGRRRREPNGAILGVPDLHRRLPGLTVEEIKDALRQLVAEGMVVVRFESTAQGKRFYVPPT